MHSWCQRWPLASFQADWVTSTTCIIPSSSWFIIWQCMTYLPVKSRQRVRKVMLPPWGTMTVSSQTGCGNALEDATGIRFRHFPFRSELIDQPISERHGAEPS